MKAQILKIWQSQNRMINLLKVERLCFPDWNNLFESNTYWKHQESTIHKSRALFFFLQPICVLRRPFSLTSWWFLQMPPQSTTFALQRKESQNSYCVPCTLLSNLEVLHFQLWQQQVRKGKICFSLEQARSRSFGACIGGRQAVVDWWKEPKIHHPLAVCRQCSPHQVLSEMAQPCRNGHLKEVWWYLYHKPEVPKLELKKGHSTLRGVARKSAALLSQ